MPQASFGALRTAGQSTADGIAWAMTGSRVRCGFLTAAFVFCPSMTMAQAPLQLPGAMSGSGGPGGPGGGTTGSAPLPPKPVAIEAPTEDTIASHVLSRDGGKGSMTFDKSGGGLVVTKMSLVGDKISKPGQVCTVDIAPSLVASLAGRPAGAIRYGVPLPGCPFNIDILDGAVLVTSAEPLCEFSAADCRVSPGGLWGPPASEITPKRAQDLEHERVRLETTMRANFRALLHRAGKDKAAVKAIAAEQAAFSSEREMTCRDYQQETTLGFCSTQITQARALALMAQFGPMKAAREHKPGIRLKVKSPAAGNEAAEPPP